MPLCTGDSSRENIRSTVNDVYQWIGYGRKVGELSSAPEFGIRGTWPPASTPWLALRWELFEASPNEASTSRAIHFLNSSTTALPGDQWDALSPRFLEGIFDRQVEPQTRVVYDAQKQISVVHHFDDSYLYRRRREEVRRIVHWARWTRGDPITQLPPDAVQEHSYSVSTGLSVEHSKTLTRSLGGELGVTKGIHATLTKQLQQQFGLKLEVTEQEQQTTKLTLTNPTRGYRLFALWRVEYLITVDALAAVWQQEKLMHSWQPRARAEFVTNIHPAVTYYDVKRRRR